jgi:hypothetical protein
LQEYIAGTSKCTLKEVVDYIKEACAARQRQERSSMILQLLAAEDLEDCMCKEYMRTVPTVRVSQLWLVLLADAHMACLDISFR